MTKVEAKEEYDNYIKILTIWLELYNFFDFLQRENGTTQITRDVMIEKLLDLKPDYSDEAHEILMGDK